METIEAVIARSLTAKSTELLPYLPYILQDLWELGASPKDVIELITKHIPVSANTQVLDLACGKGAVSVNLAKQLGCHVKGIDIMPEFIDYAIEKAKAYGVASLCAFVVGDIRASVQVEQHYDVVILGAAGDVLGHPATTLNSLKKTVKQHGYIILDDAYGIDDNDNSHPTKRQWLEIFDKTGLKLLAEKIIDEDECIALNQVQQACILKRVNALKKRYPDKVELLDGYIKSQQDECALLENDIYGVTMLLQKDDHDETLDSVQLKRG